MLNDFLLGFFLVVPAIVAALTAHDQPHPVARRIMLWGGVGFAVLITLAVLPAFLCGGGLYADYADCLGGAPLANAFNAAAPAIRVILLGYALIGPALALVVFALNWWAKRTAPKAAT
ncbi:MULTISPECIES: hypothetical protein [unclassified Marinovum]